MQDVAAITTEGSVQLLPFDSVIKLHVCCWLLHTVVLVRSERKNERRAWLGRAQRWLTGARCGASKQLSTRTPVFFLLAIALTTQNCPAGEFSTSERLVDALMEAYPAWVETERHGAMQFVLLDSWGDGFTISVSPPSPLEPSPPNVTVTATDRSDTRKSRMPTDAGVLADDGSLVLTDPRPRPKPGASVRYAAFIGADTVELLEKVWDAALIRAHTTCRTATPWISCQGFMVCIRDDIPGHSDVIACASDPTARSVAGRLDVLGRLLMKFAEAPAERRASLKQEIRATAEETLSFLKKTPAPKP
jgi:hypothetical protein